MRFVEKSGVWDVTVGGRSDTPVLEMPNVTQKNILMVTATFMAKTQGTTANGFTYRISATNPADAIPLSDQDCIVNGNAGWQTTTRTVFFEAKVSSPTGVEDIDFQVEFSKGDLDGTGQISDFLMTASIVSLVE